MDYIKEKDQFDIHKAIQSDVDNLNLQRMVGTGLIGGGVAAMTQGKRTGHFAKKSLDTWSNWLNGYYGKVLGREDLAKGGAFIKEAGKSVGGGIAGYVNPWSNYAYEATGLTQKSWSELGGYQEEINQIYDDFNQIKNPTKGKVKEYDLKLKSVHKKINAKLVSDSTNYAMFSDLKGTGTIVEKYGDVTKQVKIMDYKRASGLGHLGKNSDDIARILTDAQGIDMKNTLYALKTKSKVTGDVLFGLQFDPRSARLFAMMNQKNNKPRIDQIEKYLKSNKLSYVRRKGRIFFHLSPMMKPDPDWGGYQGVVEWNNKKPTKVRLHANDMRDWGKFRVGDRPVLNIVKPKEIGIPQILKEIKDRETRPAAKPPKRTTKHVSKPKALTDPRTKVQRQVMNKLKSQYAGARYGTALPKAFMKRFAISRLGAVGAVTGAAMLLHSYWKDKGDRKQ